VSGRAGSGRGGGKLEATAKAKAFEAVPPPHKTLARDEKNETRKAAPLFVAEGDGGVDAHGAAGRYVAGQKRDGAEEQSYRCKSERVGRLHAV
jgi:hypothetical protein